LVPKVVVHVLPPFGTVATKPAQLAVADTPAVTVTVSLVVPVPPVQYIVKDQTPALIVCSGKLENANTEVVPLAETEHGVARAPTAWSIVAGVQPGETPVPCRYRGFPADCTT
jgi:hypothetical protein